MTKRSVIRSVDDDAFRRLVQSASSRTQLLRDFGLCTHGGNTKTLQTRIEELGCPTSHFVFKRAGSQVILTLEQVFCENSKCEQQNLKRRIINNHLIPYQCRCGNNGVWEGVKLVLQLEHINGVRNDNRIENLEFLCPNCHSQTPTFAGRRHKKIRPPRPPFDKNAPRLRLRKVARPSKEELEQLVWSLPSRTLAVQLGVSDAAIGKWCNQYGIAKPGRGYWAKKKSHFVPELVYGGVD